MKAYTFDAIKHGTEPEFWEWFYKGTAKSFFFFLKPTATVKDYKKKLEKDLDELKESIEWANGRDVKDTPIILHSKKSLLAQIEGLEKVLQEIRKLVYEDTIG